MHEVSLAVKSIDETKFFAAAAALFDHQESFFDENVMDKTRRALYSELVAIAAESTGLNAADIASHLELIDSSPNCGSAVTLPMKFAAKYHRVRGVHVTPTVFMNGVEAPDISSGWSVEQWKDKVDLCLSQ